ncbi:MAG: mechanosensitive ion channel [Chloroflexi bacterium]|nr:mechanosensitive ion channel [Chloroflexota bacterium]MBP8055524.1 mechanosensitive ion channel [Chloroflexota bacterium]
MFDLDVIRTAVTSLLLGALSFVPKLFLSILILVIGHFISRFLAGVAQRLAERIGLDKMVERTGLGEGLKQANIRSGASGILAQFIYWFIFLNILVLALESLGIAAAVQQLNQLIAYLPRLLSALFVFLAGALVAQFIGRATQAAVASMGIEFHQAIGGAVRGLILIMSVIIAVERLGVDVTILQESFITMLAIILAGLALAFGLGGRDVARSVLAGYYARDVYKIGETLLVDGQEGVLIGIGTLNSEIELPDGRLIIPNTRLTEATIMVMNHKQGN